MQRVLLTDPIDASGEELLRARAADETLRMPAGEKPRNLVNPEAWDVRRPENR